MGTIHTAPCYFLMSPKYRSTQTTVHRHFATAISPPPFRHRHFRHRRFATASSPPPVRHRRFVIPAEAGIQAFFLDSGQKIAGMTF